MLVSGGPDSTALWHVLSALGYTVAALHVDHRLRGEESNADARFCRDVLGAEVVDGRGGTSEEELREIRYAHARPTARDRPHPRRPGRDRALPTRSERNAGNDQGKREDGVVRPLLERSRAQVLAYLQQENVPHRVDTSNADTKRGLIREQILPLLRQLHPAADENLLRLAERTTMPPEVAGVPRLERRLEAARPRVRCHARAGVRPRLAELTPRSLDRTLRWGGWQISTDEKGAKVRTWRPATGLRRPEQEDPGRVRRREDPRTERETWPLVVRGDEVVAVPGIVEVLGRKAERVAD